MSCASGQAMLPVAAKGSGALRSQCASFFFLNQPAFSRVITVRQLWIGRTHGRDQRVDHFAFDPVVEMARVRDIGKATPAVGNILVLGERVGDQRKGALVGLEGLCQCLGGGLALGAIAVLQQVERGLDRQLLARHLEAQRGDGLVEQTVEGRIAGLRFLVEQLLDAILELIGLVLAQILDPGAG